MFFLWYLLSNFRFQCGYSLYQWELNCLACTTQPFGVYLWQACMPPIVGLWPMWICIWPVVPPSAPLTCNCLAECFVAWWQIYPGFTASATFSPLPTWIGLWVICLLDQTVKEFENGLDSILKDSIATW